MLTCHLMQLPRPLTCTEKLVLLYIALCGEGEYSATSLALALGVSRKASHIALRRLISLEHVLVLEQPRGRRGGRYKVNSHFGSPAQ